MTSPHDIINRGGKSLTRRVWALIEQVGKENGVHLEVVQGGFRAGHGASASAGTHDKGDVYDVRILGLSRSKQLAVVEDFREWYGDAWLRTPQFGWPASAGGPHIHVVQADSHYALSRGAQQQVVAYNRGRNGLRSNAPDPFARPAHRKHFDIGHAAPVAVVRPAVRVGNLRFGLTNADVIDLQRALNAHLTGVPDVHVDGHYSAQTDHAVRIDQQRHGFGNDAAGHSSVGPKQAAHLGLRVV